MVLLSYRRHRFPPEIIQHAIWLYLRFTLSYRDVEELLAERGLDISYETVRRWVLKFGPASRDGCASVALGRAIAGIWTKWWCASAARSSEPKRLQSGEMRSPRHDSWQALALNARSI